MENQGSLGPLGTGVNLERTEPRGYKDYPDLQVLKVNLVLLDYQDTRDLRANKEIPVYPVLRDHGDTGVHRDKWEMLDYLDLLDRKDRRV